MLETLLCAAVAAAMIMALFFPETRIGNRLRELLIEWPARKLSGWPRTQIVVALLCVAAVVALIKIGNTDAMMVFGQALGEGWSWFITFDITTYVDAFLLLCLIAALPPLRAAWQAMRATGARARQWALRLAGRLSTGLMAAARSRFPHRRSPARKANPDDHAGPALGFGLA